MIGGLAKRLFGSANDRFVKSLRTRVEKINALEPALEALADDELKARTDWLRGRIAGGESLDDVLNDAFATVWDGVGSWSGRRLTGNVAGSDAPNMAVAFNSVSGDVLAVYGENENQVNYRTWSGGTWSGETNGPDIGALPNSMSLDADPFSEKIVLVALPQAFTTMIASDPRLAERWREAVRSVLTHYFARGYRAVRVVSGRYLLRRHVRQADGVETEEQSHLSGM